MTCVDCREDITETERLNAKPCQRCNGLLHAECAMAGVDEEHLCEQCFCDQEVDIEKAMRAMGVEA